MSRGSTPPSRLRAGFAGLALWTALTVGAFADTPQIALDDVISELATLVAKAVKDSNQSTVRVSGFNNPFDGEQAAGAGIRAKLIERLKKLGVESQDVAPLALKGEYQVAAADQETDSGKTEKIPAAKITYVLVSKSGKKLLDSEKPVKTEAPVYVTDHGDVAKLGSLSVEVKPDKPVETKKKLNDAIDSDAKSTTVMIDGTRVRPEQGSKFAVEIIKVKLTDSKQAPPQNTYHPAMPVLRKGVPYVDIDVNDVYAVKVYNDNDFDIAAKVTIDGMSVFQFSEERASFNEFWIYKPGESYGVFGWHKKGNEFDTFLVTEYSKDASAKSIADDSKKGQICVEFHAAWDEDAKKPADEGKFKRAGGRQSVPGPPTNIGIKTVQRFIGTFRAAVTIHYDRLFNDLPSK